MWHITQYPLSHRSRNRYVAILQEGLRAHGVDVSGIDLLRPLRHGTTDGIFLHWPENLIRTSSFLQSALYRRLIHYVTRQKDRGAIVVWFAHNELEEHVLTDYRFLQLKSTIDGVAYLSEASRNRPSFRGFSDFPSTIAKHPHYGVDFSCLVSKSPQNILLWDSAPTPRAGMSQLSQRLRVWVRHGDPDSHTAQCTSLPLRIPEEALAKLLKSQTIVVIEKQRLNSGMIYHAVSKGARVLVQASPESEEVADDIGRDWIDTFVDAEWMHHEWIQSAMPLSQPIFTERSPASVATTLLSFCNSLSRL